MDVIQVVNIIPGSHSNETFQNSEPSIAVNPLNPAQMAVTAFTPPDLGTTSGPLYYSTDGGATWSIYFNLVGGQPHDQSIAYATSSNELFGAFMRGDIGDLSVFRTTDPSTAGTLPTFDPRTGIDQPWAESKTVPGGSDKGKIRLYIGYNLSTVAAATASACVDVCLDALAGSPTFTRVKLDPRPIGAGLQNGYAIRPVCHSDGTVYVAYEGWRSGSYGGDITTDIVVARDDNWGQGSPPFSDLQDAGDHKNGRIVEGGVVIDDGGILGQERLNNDLAIAVDPTNSDIVYVVWADNAGPNYTLRARRSLNRGEGWSGDLLAVDNATMASIIINDAGRVGLLYQQLNGGNWETHFRRTTDDTGTSWDDLILSTTPADTPVLVEPPYLGDYARLNAVGKTFFGVFCANNTPDPANFPNGVAFLRNRTTTAPFQLLGTDEVTPVAASIDPFFFRIGEVDFTVTTDRNVFGRDDIDAMLQLANPTSPQINPAIVTNALYIAIDGLKGSELNISPVTFVGTPNVAPTFSFNPPLSGLTVRATACTADDPNNMNIPQRFTWTCDFVFADDSDFTQEVQQYILTASIDTTTNVTVSGQGLVILTTQPNPYETDGPTSYLSVDLQVFFLFQDGHLPSTPGIALTGTPHDFIHRLLANTGGGYNDPNLARAPNHPFDLDLVAHEDTSAIELAGVVGAFPPLFSGFRIYNFAVARVRYRALTTPAPNVRVFFRMFPASTTSTNFDPNTTYPTGGAGATKVPLLGVLNGEVVSIPFFAAPRVDPTNPLGLNAQTDPDNVGPVGEAIPPDSTGSEVQVYFGCWLDINQTAAVLPSTPGSASGPFTPTKSIQQAIRGKHQCIVAEINLDPPEPQIPAGISPGSSDKLAQRNLEIISTASPHQIPQTFDIKPTAASLPSNQIPDEIMFDWGNVPPGTLASIYLPGTSADTILSMANKLYDRHNLVRVDANTISCATRGLTYMPVPPGVGSNFAGLLTLDLPAALERNTTYKVVTRQITNTFAQRPASPPPPPSIGAVLSSSAKSDVLAWRRVLGTFQLSIPVTSKEKLLGPEERLLSVMRWIAKSIPFANRWYPVFQRYLDVLGGRVKALGGDPNSILPSPDGYEPSAKHPRKHHERGLAFTGKIVGLIFDRFGDFEGFLLDTEDGEHEFFSREKEIEELAERVWRERLRITVWGEREEPSRPMSIIVREPPAPFHD